MYLNVLSFYKSESDSVKMNETPMQAKLSYLESRLDGEVAVRAQEQELRTRNQLIAERMSGLLEELGHNQNDAGQGSEQSLQ